ncbi:hypothetical protein LTR84_006201 [Exophiala bonariae]|uniref:Uncharacterized protein n=1 Tax=Exophiala bonariae TaxID=1690606 RepID=A0AAV9N5F0_9EURO|nr:hypothetical protein LTR84_006201 [Exophiala bonariae]
MTIMTAAQRRGWKDQDLNRMPAQIYPGPYVTHQSVALAHSASASTPGSSVPSATYSQISSNPLYHSVHQKAQSDNYDPVWRRPAQQLSAEHSDQVVRPVRSRSRLQKRPSQRAMKSSHMSSIQKKASFDKNNLTALPQQSDPSTVPERSSSLRLRQVRHSAGTDRPKTAKEKPDRTDAVYSDGNQPFTHSQTTVPTRPRTAPSVDNLKSRTQTRTQPPLPTQTSTAPVQSPLPASNRTPRHVALAPYDPFPLNPLYHIPSPPLSSPDLKSAPTSHPSLKSSSKNEQITMAAQQQSRHQDRAITPSENATQQLAAYVQAHPPKKRSVTIPTTHDTVVTETMHPAVTREVIREHRIEVLREEITREIHVHHYFTHVQPVRALEVLPARHFLVDPETGEKKEIPEPEGWSMPANLQPRTPDTSILAPVTRHYLVNEQHPLGILESSPPPHPPPTQPLPAAPLMGKEEEHYRTPSTSRRPPSAYQNAPKNASDEMKALAAASHKATWTPFPRSTSKASQSSR